MEASAVSAVTGFSTGLAEIVLVVDNVPQAARFYREVVGLTTDDTADEANEARRERIRTNRRERRVGSC